MTTYLGIDLAWGEKNPTGVAVLDEGGRLQHVSAVRTDDGEFTGRAVVVATDPVDAGSLLPQLTSPTMKSLTTYWFSTPEAPSPLNLLFVDGRGRRSGPVINTAVMSHAAPSYAPAGRHLVQATLLQPDGSTEHEVRERLSRIYGVSTGGWELVIGHDGGGALPVRPSGSYCALTCAPKSTSVAALSRLSSTTIAVVSEP